MLYFGGLIGAALFLLWVFCIIDVIMTPDSECRHLPKLVWLMLVIVLTDLGSAAWLLAGRPWPNGSPLERAGLFGGSGRGGTGAGSRYPEYDHPDRFQATNPDDDEAFLAQVRERAEAQRRAEATRRREREQAEAAERQRRQETRGGAGTTDPGGPTDTGSEDRPGS